MRKRFEQTARSRGARLRHFVNRSAELSALKSAANARTCEDLSVFNIFSLGGQGKSSLLEKFESYLQENHPKLPCARFDVGSLFNPDESCRDTLLWIYTDLKTSVPGLLLPRYEVAEVVCHAITRDGAGTFREVVWDVAGNCSFGLAKLSKPIIESWSRKIPWILRAGESLEKITEHFLSRIAGSELNDFVIYLQNLQREELQEALIGSFVADLEKASQATGGCKAVIILDTYEELWREHEFFGSVHAPTRDCWVRSLAQHCLGHGILLVIAGREKLLWEKWCPDDGWERDIIDIDLAGLARQHVCELIASRLPAASDELISAIASYSDDATGKETGSCHPLSVELAIELCHNESKKSGNLPTPDSFNGSCDLNQTEKLALRFLRSLPDGKMQTWLIELSASLRFDVDLALALDRDRNHAVGRAGWNSLIDFSFVYEDQEGTYHFHRVLHRVLQAELRRRRDSDQVFSWLGGYCLERTGMDMIDQVFIASLETSESTTRDLLAKLAEKLATLPMIHGSHYATGLMDAFHRSGEKISDKLADITKFLVSLEQMVAGYAVMKFCEQLFRTGRIEAASKIQTILDNCSNSAVLFAKLSDLEFQRIQGASKDLATSANSLLERGDLPPIVRQEVLFLRGEGFREQGKHDRAIESYHAALATPVDDTTGSNAKTRCRTQTALADLTFVRGEPDEAMRIIEGARNELAHFAGNRAVQKARLLRIEGQIHLSLGYVDKARKCFQSTLLHAQKHGRPFLIVEATNSLAEADIAAGKDATDLLDSAFALASRIGFVLERGKTRYLKALHLASMDEFEEAILVLDQSEDDLNQCGYASGRARIHLVRGAILSRLEHNYDAAAHALKALRYYQNEGIYPWLRMQAYALLVRCSKKKALALAKEAPFSLDEIIGPYSSFLSLVPPGMVSRQAVKDFDKAARSKDTSETLSGYYNLNSKRWLASEQVVLRIPFDAARSVDVKMIPEATILRFLEDNDVDAPRLVFERQTKDLRYLTYKFIPGDCLHHRFPAQIECPDWVPECVSAKMARCYLLDCDSLHGYCEEFYKINRPRDFMNYLVDFLLELFEQWNDKYGGFWEDLGIPKSPLSIVSPNDLEPERRFGLCHCDVHRKNMILANSGNEIHLIDWELSLIADPAYEVAVHLHKMRYTPEQEGIFIRSYLGMIGFDIGKNEILKDISCHRNLEVIKSGMVDAVRLIDDVQSNPAKIVSLVRRYCEKLRKAYVIWGMESQQGIIEGRVVSAVSKRIPDLNKYAAKGLSGL